MDRRSFLFIPFLIYCASAIDLRPLETELKEQLRPLETLNRRIQLAAQKHNFKYGDISVECTYNDRILKCILVLRNIKDFIRLYWRSIQSEAT
jgi:hypothetical protein